MGIAVDWIDPPEKAAPPAMYKPFPLHCLPEPVRGYVAEAASALGVDPAYVALPALAACVSAIGNTRAIQLKRGWTEPAVLWAAVVAESGAIKSPSLDAAVKPMYRVQQALLKRYRAAMLEYTNEKLSAKGTDKRPQKSPFRSASLSPIQLLRNWVRYYRRMFAAFS